KATFFELAKNVVAMPSLVKRVKAEGHALANHSYSHAQLTKLGASGLKKEIDDSTVVETKYFGFKPTLFRCPYGACGGNGSTIRKKIAAQGMVHVFWNVDSLDWQDKNAKSVYNRIKKQMSVQKRGIILCHDIHPQTVEATKMLMDDFVKGQKDGSLRLVTIPQAIKELNSGGMQ
ncbi:MAG: polysaccharide deacetylase family protein, partial [Proteobacteria bacterium]